MEEFNIPADKLNLVSCENVNNNFTYVVEILEHNWEQFVAGQTENKIIRKEILRSWVRCRDNSVDPYKGYNKNILTFDQLKERRSYVNEMIVVAEPFMQSLYHSLKGSGYIIMLHDKDGVLLELFGDLSMRRIAEALDVMPGATCDEKVVGTTAPGISLKEKIPAQVFSREHYCMPYHSWTCSAAPIFDPEGKLIGSLNLTGLYNKVHPHTLGLVIASARAIERELGYRAIHYKLKKTYHYIDTIIDSVPEGMLLFTDKGEINHINAACANLLGVSIKECHGVSINKIIKNAEALTGLMARERHTCEKKLSLTTEKGIIEVNVNFKAIRDGAADTVTYMVTFNETGRVQKNINKNAGFSAYYTFDDIVFVSKKMQDIINYAKRISSIDTTVLIEAESGTGKELLAQAIHNYSGRSKKPFMVVNCAALPQELIHSELFGYEEGSFTGARKGGKPGKFELANGGTIFLDEIGDMPLEVQANMLRVLQEKRFMRIGGNQNIDLDIRVIAATNKRLASEVEQGTFRLDLFYRLNTVPIKIPPLRERTGDIMPLARYFVDRLCFSQGRTQVLISSEAEKVFLAYHWPGNIRELENTIICMINTLDGDTIEPHHLPEEMRAIGLVKPFSINTLEELVEDLERKTIIAALNYYNKNISRAAQGLGITRATLYKKLKKYNLN